MRNDPVPHIRAVQRALESIAMGNAAIETAEVRHLGGRQATIERFLP